MLVVALAAGPAGERRDHMADLAAILLATTIFWAYLEFMQFLIIWEENLKTEIPWYLIRLNAGLAAGDLRVSRRFGFVMPFFVLLWAPAKRSRAVVASVCVLDPAQPRRRHMVAGPAGVRQRPPFWLDVSGSAGARRRHAGPVRVGPPRRHRGPARFAIWRADHA